MNMVRKVLETTYTDECSVVERKKTKENGVVSVQEKTVLEHQPCRLSFSALDSASQTDAAAAVKQVTKLFLAPEIEIKSGSKIIVQHCGREWEYTRSGVPAVYDTHQEIILDLFKEWA